MTEEQPPLLVAHAKGAALLTLNRPNALNALSRALRRALLDALAAAERDPDVRAVVLTGAGRSFCVGLDLKELAQSEASVASLVSDQNLGSAIAELRKPVIGAINGPAITGGLEIALACDMLVASETATFADTHVHVGLTPGWGLSQRLSRTVGQARAKEISLTGRPIDAALALRWGLVNHVVAPEELMDTALSIAAAIAANRPSEVRALRDLIGKGAALALPEALALESVAAADRNGAITAREVAARVTKPAPDIVVSKGEEK